MSIRLQPTFCFNGNFPVFLKNQQTFIVGVMSKKVPGQLRLQVHLEYIETADSEEAMLRAYFMIFQSALKPAPIDQDKTIGDTEGPKETTTASALD
jgi:hypothetical protein